MGKTLRRLTLGRFPTLGLSEARAEIDGEAGPLSAAFTVTWSIRRRRANVRPVASTTRH
jgi:hypothetical protein